MPVKGLPDGASLDHLKYQAKDLINEHKARDAKAAQRIREFHPRFHDATDQEILDAPFRLSDAQLTIARERGFASWTRLKRRIEKPTRADEISLPAHERIAEPLFRRAVDLLDAGDAEGLRAHLAGHPEIVRMRMHFEGGNYFRMPSLIEFVAENPTRRGKLPANIVEVATVILEAGAKDDQASLDETLGLVSSGMVPRQCGVQLPLIDLLCRYGANPDKAMLVALPHGEFEAARALLGNGAKMNLPIAAALGLTEEAGRVLPAASASDRHRALTLAAQFGHAEIMRLLLDAGEDPNRYNPMGFHSHATPLHQAALAGHFDVVRLLVERGARLDMGDAMHQGTPEGWARRNGQPEIADYLHEQAHPPDSSLATK